MLNVPDEVKALFKRDGVRKNFRVHFPNGELPDITNENIVQESVKFTESLCSQDVLKFGLTEASVIEFETVGIGNMYGMTIECGIEIDLSSLTAAQLNDIASGTWDGVYTDAASSDIGYAYFRVPYGTFRVDSCPRDHQAMAHRKVQAYNVFTDMFKISPFENFKLNSFFLGNQTFTGGIRKIVIGNIGYYNSDFLQDFTKSSAGSFEGHIFDLSLTVRSEKYGINLPATFRVRYKSITVGYGGDLDADNLFEFLIGKYNSQPIIDGLEELDANFIVPVQYSSFQQIFNNLVLKYPSYCELKRTYNLIDSKSYYELTSDVPCFYPYRGAESIDPSDSNNRYSVTIYICQSIELISTDSSFPTATYNALYHNTVALNVFTDTELDFDITINHTFEGTYGIAGTTYAYCNSYSISALLNGYLELYARFGRINRNNKFESIVLSTANPTVILPPQYINFWWDEYDVLPVFCIKYSYVDVDNTEQVIAYTFGSEGSIYDMTGNEVIKKMSNGDTGTIETILDNNFIPNLSPIAFTPIDLTMKGLPYMEAGDYLAVTAEDGIIANSFNMKMEISGIQVLTASIESTSGDIIESGESE